MGSFIEALLSIGLFLSRGAREAINPFFLREGKMEQANSSLVPTSPAAFT
jgi:hypothetical protein